MLMTLSRIVSRDLLSVPIWLSLSFSEFFFCFSQWNSLPEHAPIPGSSSEAVLVSSTLGLDGEPLAVYGVDQRHGTHRSDRVGVGSCIQDTRGSKCRGEKEENGQIRTAVPVKCKDIEWGVGDRTKYSGK